MESEHVDEDKGKRPLRHRRGGGRGGRNTRLKPLNRGGDDESSTKEHAITEAVESEFVVHESIEGGKMEREQNDESKGEDASETTHEPKKTSALLKKVMKKKKKHVKRKVDKGEVEARVREEKLKGLQTLFPGTTDCDSYDNLILSITINHADALEPKSMSVHPLVRVSLFDAASEQLLQKLDPKESVVSAHEYRFKDDQLSNLDYVIPVMAHPVDFRKDKSTVPQWNENIVLNIDYLYCLRKDVLLFVEILEFGEDLPLGRKINTKDGYARIAWGFLRLVRDDGRANTEKDIRLQMYRYALFPENPNMFCCIPRSVPQDMYPRISVWDEFNRGLSSYRAYPSTMYIRVEGATKPKMTEVTTRAQNPFEVEVGEMDFENLKKATSGVHRSALSDGDTDFEEERFSLRMRGPREQCELPESQLFQFDGGEKGCLALSYSNSGKYLAAGCSGAFFHTVRLFDVVRGIVKANFEGHRGTVYDVSFSADDSEIVTCGADRSVRVWNAAKYFGKRAVENLRKYEEDESDADQLLNVPHPCFVYCARRHPTCTTPRIIVTGGYDRQLRVIDRDEGRVIHTISSHRSYVNSVIFNEDGTNMYTGDGVGIVRIWNSRVRAGDTVAGSFVCLRTIEEKEMMGRPINSVRLQPGGKLLLVTTRDNLLRTLTVDLETTIIAKRYTGMRCESHFVKGEFSADGMYVVCGSENGRLYFWNTSSGDLLDSEGLSIGYEGAVCAAVWNPCQHAVAVCAFGYQEPIRVFCHEKDDDAVLSEEEVSEGEPTKMQPKGVTFAGDAMVRMIEAVNTNAAHATGPATRSAPLMRRVIKDNVGDAKGMPSLVELVRARRKKQMPKKRDSDDADAGIMQRRVADLIAEIQKERDDGTVGQ